MGVIVPLLCIFFILYAYLNHNAGFTTTVSALRQFWSDECRLSCLQSDSGFSGMSGLNHPPNAGNCVCDSCPCIFVENIMRSCEPATSLYAQFVELVSDYCYETVLNMTTLFEYVIAGLCRESRSERQAQVRCATSAPRVQSLLNTQGLMVVPVTSYAETEKKILKLNGSTNNGSNTFKPSRSLTFDERPPQELPGDKVKIRKESLEASGTKVEKDPSNRSYMKTKLGRVEKEKDAAGGPSNLSTDPDIVKNTQTMKEPVVIPVNLKGYEEMTRQSSDSLSDSAICSRCIEEGNVCVKKCPRAKAKK